MYFKFLQPNSGKKVPPNAADALIPCLPERIFMLSAESFALPRKRSGRRRWVKLRVHVRRLANVGANAVELRGLFGTLARVVSWLGFLALLLGSFVQRLAKRIYRFGADLLDGFLDRLRAHNLHRWQVYQEVARFKSLFHRREHGRAAPLLLLATATVLIISACNFGLGYEVKLDGQSLGYVESPAQVEDLVQRVEDRISAYLGTPYQLETNFSYSMRYLDRTTPLDEDLLEQRLFASVGDISRRYVLTVDGETIGACRSKSALELMLRRILLSSTPTATQVNTAFVNDVQILETTSKAIPDVPLTKMEAILTANKAETLVYTVKSGDTVSAIGQAYDLTVSEIKALNPGLDEARINIGQQLTLSAAVPYLSVQQTITEAYVAPIPYETIIQYDDTMYTNTSKISKAGVEGSADVVADVTYVNGVETGRNITSYKVLADPVSAIKLVGTKERPRYMATGTFIKPSNGRFSSGYGWRKSLGDFHTGVDFAGATGTKIWAADGGVVTFAGWKGNYGRLVIIDHQNGYTTYYAHCSKLLVKVGDKVAKGDQIAKVGNTGRSYGSHVHFEIRKNGKTQNPLNYISK